MKVIGDVVKDASPNKYDGEIKEAKWVKGKFGYALEFKKGNTVARQKGNEKQGQCHHVAPVY